MSIIRGPFDGYTSDAIASGAGYYDPRYQQDVLTRNINEVNKLGQLWRDAFFRAMNLRYSLEESVAYANGAVDSYSAKIKEITNVKE